MIVMRRINFVYPFKILRSTIPYPLFISPLQRTSLIIFHIEESIPQRHNLHCSQDSFNNFDKSNGDIC